jgi:hypothetical protein
MDRFSIVAAAALASTAQTVYDEYQVLIEDELGRCSAGDDAMTRTGSHASLEIAAARPLGKTGCFCMVRPVLLGASGAIVCLLSSGTTKACLPDSSSRTQVSPGGDYILVMVSPLPVAEDGGNDVLDTKQGGARVRDKYRQSGLYRNDGSSKPLWRIPFTDGNLPAHVAPDGTCVVFGADPCEFGPHAVTIYYAGDRVVTLSKSELIPCCFSKRVLAILCKRKRLDPIRGNLDNATATYTMTTEQGEVFVLDVKTGRLMETVSRWPFYAACFVLLVPGLVALIWYRPWLRSWTPGGDQFSFRRHAGETPKPAWKRYSMRSAFAGISLFCIGLAFRELVFLGLLVAITIGVGGLVAICLKCTFRCFFIGGALGWYGFVLGFILGDILYGGRLPSTMGHICFLLTPPSGLLLAALIAGTIERGYSRFRDGLS